MPFLEPTFYLCLCRFSLTLSAVKEDKVQAAVMPPAPGLVIMRFVDGFDRVSDGGLGREYLAG